MLTRGAHGYEVKLREWFVPPSTPKTVARSRKSLGTGAVHVAGVLLRGCGTVNDAACSMTR